MYKGSGFASVTSADRRIGRSLKLFETLRNLRTLIVVTQQPLATRLPLASCKALTIELSPETNSTPSHKKPFRETFPRCKTFSSTPSKLQKCFKPSLQNLHFLQRCRNLEALETLESLETLEPWSLRNAFRSQRPCPPKTFHEA